MSRSKQCECVTFVWAHLASAGVSRLPVTEQLEQDPRSFLLFVSRSHSQNDLLCLQPRGEVVPRKTGFNARRHVICDGISICPVPFYCQKHPPKHRNRYFNKSFLATQTPRFILKFTICLLKESMFEPVLKMLKLLASIVLKQAGK